MIKQALITLLVAVIVIVIARIKRGREQARERGGLAPANEQAWYQSPTAIVGLIFAGIVIAATAGVTWMRFQHANEVVRIEVVEPASGTRTVYQVRRKDLGERAFRTIDGREVSLASSDRVERVE